MTSLVCLIRLHLVDHSPSFDFGQEGWSYASDFHLGKFRPYQSQLKAFVRKRKWVRTRQRVSAWSNVRQGC